MGAILISDYYKQHKYAYFLIKIT